MTKNNQAWEDYSSTQFGKLASVFARILNGGLSLKDRSAPAVLFRFPIACFTASCRTAFKLWPFITSADVQAVGGTV